MDSFPRLVAFDLDGTLVDSRLDFNAIRSEMGLMDDELILEAVDSMPAGERRNQCVEVLKRISRVKLRNAVEPWLLHNNCLVKTNREIDQQFIVGG